MQGPIPTSIAPMEGLTTFPSRLWLSMASRPLYATTPFLHLTKTFPERSLPLTFAPELSVLKGALPYQLTPQFLTCDTDHFLRAVDLLPTLENGVELNCGCPTPNGAGKYAGSGILQDAGVFGAAIETLSSRLGSGRLAVKMRLGISDADEIDVLVGQIARLPLAKLTVHGRTRADKYRGRARWDKIELAAKASSTPTWASGDVFNATAFQALCAAAPSISGVVIGRGLMHNPWVFEELRTATPIVMDPLSLVNAVHCYGMLHELWMTAPEKLIARVASGRIGGYCGAEFAHWERLSVTLTNMLGAAPFAIFDARPLPDELLSGTSFKRMKVLWSYLRTSLPLNYQAPKALRAKNARDFFAEVLASSGGGEFILTVPATT